MPADWDGRNTYDPQERPQDWDGKNKPEASVDPVQPVTPPYTPELPADWDGRNTYDPQERPQDWDGKNKPEASVDPVQPVTPPYTPELPADWDGRNTYDPQERPQDWDGKNKPEASVDILDMDDDSIEHLLQSNFGSAEPKSHVSGAEASVHSAPNMIGFDDTHLQIKATNGDF